MMEAMLSVYLGTALARSNPSQADRAEQFAERGIEIAGSLKVRTVEAQMHLSLGELYVNVGQTEKALSSLKKARQMCREIGLEYYLAKTEKAMEKLEARG